MISEKYDLIILAGGKGSRIKSYLKQNPKPMLKVGKTSILERIIYQFSKFNFKNIFIITGYKNKKIINKFHNKIINFNKIICLNEPYPMGTGGYILKYHKRFTKEFYILNADSITEFNFKNFQNLKLKNKLGKIVLTKNNNYKENLKLNNLYTDRKKIIHTNKNTKKNKKNIFMNAGIYFLKRNCFNIKKLTYKKVSLENDIILPLINKKQILGFESHDFFLDIGTPKNLKISRSKKVSKRFCKSAVFFDRDGTINEDIGYLHEFKKFKLRKNILKSLIYLKKKNVLLFLITNQAGIGKKKFSMKQFILFQRKFKSYFFNYDIFFDDIMFCPFHPKAVITKYKKQSLYRKPGNLMVKSVLKRWDINVKKSLFIGDKKIDELCANKSKIKFLYYAENIDELIKNKI